jgi:hypothetical protein
MGFPGPGRTSSMSMSAGEYHHFIGLKILVSAVKFRPWPFGSPVVRGFFVGVP